MKKLLFVILLTGSLLIASMANAAWTIRTVNPQNGIVLDEWVAFALQFTSDNDALSATNVLSYIHDSKLKEAVNGSVLYAINVSPGAGGVAPDGAMTFTLTNLWGKTVLSAAAVSHVADSWPSVIGTIGNYPMVMDVLNIAFTDTFTSGDQVTLYFYFWKERGRN